MKYEWYQPAGFLNCNRAIDWLRGSHSTTSWPLENHFGACSRVEVSLWWLLISREAGEVFPLLLLMELYLNRWIPTPHPSVPWHQNCQIRQWWKALLKTQNSQVQLLCCSYQSGVYSWRGKSPRCCWTTRTGCSDGRSRGGGGCSLSQHFDWFLWQDVLYEASI